MTNISPQIQHLLDDAPLIDVRAPVEFSKGAFPSATNLPILNDEERSAVGTCYKEKGPGAALALGYDLVSADVKSERLEAWVTFLSRHPDACLYCFRGGDRSRIACEWLAEAGFVVPRIEGGYKALRRSMLEVYEQLPALLVVSGRTGSGKTLFLKNFSQVVDLEGIANHRGSAFGGHLTPQPSQIDFENELAIDLLRYQSRGQLPILIEDEGRLIGRLHVPSPLQDALKTSPLLVIEDDIEIRAQRILDEYIDEQSARYTVAFGEAALDELEAYLLGAVQGIRKRLGGAAHQEVQVQIREAMFEQRRSGDMTGHLPWIRRLLADYYDPMYDYQLQSRTDRVMARGSHEALLAWIEQHPEFGEHTGKHG